MGGNCCTKDMSGVSDIDKAKLTVQNDAMGEFKTRLHSELDLYFSQETKFEDIPIYSFFSDGSVGAINEGKASDWIDNAFKIGSKELYSTGQGYYKNVNLVGILGKEWKKLCSLNSPPSDYLITENSLKVPYEQYLLDQQIRYNFNEHVGIITQVTINKKAEHLLDYDSPLSCFALFVSMNPISPNNSIVKAYDDRWTPNLAEKVGFKLSKRLNEYEWPDDLREIQSMESYERIKISGGVYPLVWGKLRKERSFCKGIISFYLKQKICFRYVLLKLIGSSEPEYISKIKESKIDCEKRNIDCFQFGLKGMILKPISKISTQINLNRYNSKENGKLSEEIEFVLIGMADYANESSSHCLRVIEKICLYLNKNTKMKDFRGISIHKIWIIKNSRQDIKQRTGEVLEEIANLKGVNQSRKFVIINLTYQNSTQFQIVQCGINQEISKNGVVSLSNHQINKELPTYHYEYANISEGLFPKLKKLFPNIREVQFTQGTGNYINYHLVEKNKNYGSRAYIICVGLPELNVVPKSQQKRFIAYTMTNILKVNKLY